MKVKISDIHPMVEASAYKELETVMEGSIDFHHPIILLRTTKDEWSSHKEKSPFIFNPPDIDGEILQIRCGHNRVELLKRVGIETVDALIFDSLDEATEECVRQNKWHKRKYGALV